MGHSPRPTRATNKSVEQKSWFDSWRKKEESTNPKLSKADIGAPIGKTNSDDFEYSKPAGTPCITILPYIVVCAVVYEDLI